MRVWIIRAAVGLLGVAVLVGCLARPTAPGTLVTVTRAQLDTALAAALAQGAEVDFPEKTRFTALRFDHGAGLGITGRARFFDPATGGYPPPDIAFFGTVPPGYWAIDNGALNLRLVLIDGAAPLPGGLSPDSAAADRVRDSLSTSVGDMMGRMSFPTGLDPRRRWMIGSVEITPTALRFELRPR